MSHDAARPGPLASVTMDGELPRRSELPKIVDELDHQFAVQAYLWALPLVSYEAVSFSAAMKSRTPEVGQAYLSTYTGTDGEWLDGGRQYRLRVPADPPAKLFWSATVYDAETRCLIDNEQARGDRGSRDADLARNDDGSVDVYFGPEPPPSGETNWVQTVPGRHWFSYFRLYGPLEPYFDRSWKLGDVMPA